MLNVQLEKQQTKLTVGSQKKLADVTQTLNEHLQQLQPLVDWLPSAEC